MYTACSLNSLHPGENVHPNFDKTCPLRGGDIKDEKTLIATDDVLLCPRTRQDSGWAAACAERQPCP
jgi:hypothetical protein